MYVTLNINNNGIKQCPFTVTILASRDYEKKIALKLILPLVLLHCNVMIQNGCRNDCCSKRLSTMLNTNTNTSWLLCETSQVSDLALAVLPKFLVKHKNIDIVGKVSHHVVTHLFTSCFVCVVSVTQVTSVPWGKEWPCTIRRPSSPPCPSARKQCTWSVPRGPRASPASHTHTHTDSQMLKTFTQLWLKDRQSHPSLRCGFNTECPYRLPHGSGVQEVRCKMIMIIYIFVDDFFWRHNWIMLFLFVTVLCSRTHSGKVFFLWYCCHH